HRHKKPPAVPPPEHHPTMSTSTQPSSAPAASRRRPGLKARHLHFIALGSAIGTGLFYGSAGAIQAAGPSVLLVYLLGGAVVYFMLRALGEMAVRMPISGSFAEYTRRSLGPWAGYITGWMFAFEMLIVCLADLTAIAIYMRFWFPDTAQWVWVALTLLIVGAANLASVRWFGELEFAFTIVKVGAVVAMIAGGAAILAFGLGDPGAPTGLANLAADGGFFPAGPGGMVSAFILVLFAFGGTEIIGVAGTEAEDPAQAIPRAVNTVPVRILLFYVLAIGVILLLTPWRQITGEESPFVQIFDTLGVSWAAAALNVVVITAALSAINADLFGAGRPVRGVPVVPTLALLGVLVVGVVLNWALPDEVFTIVASLAPFATVFVWLMILLAQVSSRRGMSRAERDALEFPVPLWPYGQVFAIAFILFTLGIMVWEPEYHTALAVGAGFTALMSVLYIATVRRRSLAR